MTTSAASSPHVLETTGQVIATTDERFVSYNVEMVEVTGGEFWKPYDAGKGKVLHAPIDLAAERLRNLASALGPSYVRVSGSWANWTYFDPDATAGTTAPRGFDGLLTGEQWIGVGEFARAVDALVVTSFPSSRGARDAGGVWRDDSASTLIRFSQSHDVPVVAAEFFNEASLPIGVPKGYAASEYERDFAIFAEVMREIAPEIDLVGPGSTSEAISAALPPTITPEELLAASAQNLNVFSYHFYPKLSERCGSTEGPEVAFSAEFLGRVDTTKANYERLRDRHLPGAPMWVTEIAQAGCGGDRWASTYRDVVRFVHNLGRLAVGDGNVMFHNTLAASDYGLIDGDTLVPRPNYWAAVLWKRLMGRHVLSPKTTAAGDDVTIFAHDHATAAGTSFAVVNASTSTHCEVVTPSGDALVYRLDASDLDARDVSLNGALLRVEEDGTLPPLDALETRGPITVPPAAVVFVVDPAAAISAR